MSPADLRFESGQLPHQLGTGGQFGLAQPLGQTSDRQVQRVDLGFPALMDVDQRRDKLTIRALTDLQPETTSTTSQAPFGVSQRGIPIKKLYHPNREASRFQQRRVLPGAGEIIQIDFLVNIQPSQRLTQGTQDTGYVALASPTKRPPGLSA